MLLILLPLGGCLGSTGDSGVALRPVVAIERSGGPGPWTEVAMLRSEQRFRVPQMKAVRVPGWRPPVGGFTLPVAEGVLTSTFGLRDHPILGGDRIHSGIDLAAPAGTPIRAAAAGTIEVVGSNGGYGRYIRIRHDGSLSTAYGHMSRFASGIRPGSTVRRGQVIGYVGSTGRSTGPHLHWEVLFRDKPLDPLPMLPSETRLALLDGATVAHAVGGR